MVSEASDITKHYKQVVGSKRIWASSRAAPWWVMVSMPMAQTDGRQSVTSRFPLDVARARV